MIAIQVGIGLIIAGLILVATGLNVELEKRPTINDGRSVLTISNDKVVEAATWKDATDQYGNPVQVLIFKDAKEEQHHD